MLHGEALGRGRCARGPQQRQQQRRFAQVRPAAFLPVRAVRTCCDRVEGGDEAGPVGRAVLRFLGHPRDHQGPQRFGHRVQRHRLGQMLIEQRLGGVCDEGRAADQALIEGGGGRVNVAGRTGRSARKLLGGRVDQGARGGRPVTGPGCDAEVGQLARAVAVDQHVLWLVVPVHDTALVRCGQSEQRAPQDDQRGLRGSGALVREDLPERHAVDQFHDDGRARRGLEVLIEPDHVRIVQGGQHGRLAAEHPGEFGVGQQVRAQVLDRHQGA